MSEKRLIDADKLMERFRIVAQSGGPVVVHVSDICAAIEDEVYEGTVDAVEVVRCNDCSHRVRGTWAKCTGRRPDDFCSDGERRFHD